MPTPSYLVAQRVIPKIKAQCPRIVIPARGAGRLAKNRFTFFAGSDHEQTVQFRRMMAHADPFWDPLDVDPMLRDWETRINAIWLSHAYTEILTREIYAVMGIPEGTYRYALEGDLPWIIGRALQIAKTQIWGIPVNLRRESWFFHRLIAGCAKRTVPEAVWKLACANAGNVYGVNENVLMDAIMERKAYQALYAIHPLLGRSWAPWIRGFVARNIQDREDHSRYAKQLSSALGACGVRKSGVKTLHRMAESSPMTFRKVMKRVVGNAVEASEETIAMLNALNGRKPSGVTFKGVIERTSDSHVEPARHPEDILVMARIDQWLTKDMRFDRGLVQDWMRSLARERRGSLYRGYLDVTKNIKSPAARKEAALAWANRSQQTWHRHLPAPEAAHVYPVERRSFRWEPILDDPVFRMKAENGEWTFVELTSSEALREEGDAMQHCVAGYDGDCHRGQSHIFSVRFSVRDAKGFRVSTLELRPKQKTRKGAAQYAIAQNRGACNAAVSIACKTAAEQFLKQVNEFMKIVTYGRGSAEIG